MKELSIKGAIEEHLRVLEKSKSPNTLRSYRGGLICFLDSIRKKGIDPDKTNITHASESWIQGFMDDISDLAVSSQHVYISAVNGWYRFLLNNKSIPIDFEAVRQYTSKRPTRLSRKSSIHPPFEEINRVIDYAMRFGIHVGQSDRTSLRYLRNRAIILVMVDVDIQLDKLCDLTCGDLSWSGGIATMAVPNNGISYLELSRRASDAVSEYLSQRSGLDSGAGMSPAKLCVFARHDPGAGKKVLPISPTTLRAIVNEISTDALGVSSGSLITPRTLRQYSATSIMNRNISLLHTKIVHRCKAAFESGQFDDAIFNAMKVVEEEVRRKSGLGPTDLGKPLMSKAFSSSSPILKISSVASEQESGYFLFGGAIGLLKNPQSHRYIGTNDPIKAFECLAFGSLLLRILDEI